MGIIPVSWKIAAAAALVGALLVGHVVRVRHAYGEGHDAAVSERLVLDARATAAALVDNGLKAQKQAADNVAITKAKNEEIAPVRERIVTRRVLVGPAICAGTPATNPESPASSDGANSPGRLVRADLERDFVALKLAVEEDLATGRACQAFLTRNGLAP